jgi:hypothetical protein
MSFKFQFVIQFSMFQTEVVDLKAVRILCHETSILRWLVFEEHNKIRFDISLYKPLNSVRNKIKFTQQVLVQASQTKFNRGSLSNFGD